MFNYCTIVWSFMIRSILSIMRNINLEVSAVVLLSIVDTGALSLEP